MKRTLCESLPFNDVAHMSQKKYEKKIYIYEENYIRREYI